MKNKIIFLLIGLLVLLSLFFFACEEDVDPVQERVDAFLSDLNNDAERDDIYQNLASSMNSAWVSPSAWLGNYFGWANEPFNFTGMTYGSSTASGTVTHSTDPGSSIEIYLIEEETDNYKIYQIDVNSSSVIY